MSVSRWWHYSYTSWNMEQDEKCEGKLKAVNDGLLL